MIVKAEIIPAGSLYEEILRQIIEEKINYKDEFEKKAFTQSAEEIVNSSLTLDTNGSFDDLPEGIRNVLGELIETLLRNYGSLLLTAISGYCTDLARGRKDLANYYLLALKEGNELTDKMITAATAASKRRKTDERG